MKRQSFALTDIGMKRKINQDAFLKDDELGLYVVADGMGGHRGGEVASRIAIESIQRYCQENRQDNARDQLDKSINLACREIYRQSLENEELSGMGTTVASILFQNNSVFIGQVGDSRVYLLRKNVIWQVTEDHSLLNEEIRAGRLDVAQVSSYQFKNVITRSVGYENYVNVDIYHRDCLVGDRFLLCSDGLSGLVEIQEISDEIEKNGPHHGLKNLVNLANSRGGDDNTTVLICEVLGD